MTGFLDSLSDIGRGFMEHRLRLGITGLSRAGKTVLLTALVQGLLHPDRLKLLTAHRDGRYRAALLRPQPSQTLPRFPFEANVARLTGRSGAAATGIEIEGDAATPHWPEGTTRQAELRLSIRYRPAGLWSRLGDEVLHLDLFDYPGEWLLDLMLLEHDFDSWSAALLEEMAAPHAATAARPYLDFIAGLEPDAPAADAEQQAIQAAALFRRTIQARQDQAGRALALHPGRFLLPGDLEGAPILTFAPLAPPSSGQRPGRRGREQSVRQLMRERFEAYLNEVVRPFHRRHFARLDRQLVLVDALGAVSSGDGAAIDALDREMAAVQQALRLGHSWLPRSLRPSIERVLFACSKADHLPSDQHPALEELVRRSLSRSLRQTTFGGAETEVISLSALRATREVGADGKPGRRYLAGRPAGEAAEVAHFPGRLGAESGAFDPLSFQPPRGLSPDAGWPHLRLDRAIDFLIGDQLK